MADTVDAVDEFAQTRGGDDLFDDEIIPVATEEPVQTEVQPQVEAPEKLSESTSQTVPAQTPTRPRGAEKGRGRGRGRGRGGRGASGNRRNEGGAKGSKPAESVAETESADSVEDSAREKPEKGTDKEDDAASDSKAPSASNGSESPRVPAVRGDRSATGGIRKVWAKPWGSMHMRLLYANCHISRNSRKSNSLSVLQQLRKTQPSCQPRMLVLKQTKHLFSSVRRWPKKSVVRNARNAALWTRNENVIVNGNLTP